MKHYLTILIPLCVTGVVAISIVALERGAFVLFRFGESEIMIDAR